MMEWVLAGLKCGENVSYEEMMLNVAIDAV
jgi:hypothetical protein